MSDELEDLIATNISFAMRRWAEEKPEEKPRGKVGFEDFAKHFVERRNRILNLYTKRTLDEVEAYISKHYIKKEDVLEAIETNQKGQFEDDAGLICWYLDDLVSAIKKLNIGDK